MKIISKKYWQDMKNFVEQISIKLWFLLKTNLDRDEHTKISVEILNRPIFKRSNIGW